MSKSVSNTKEWHCPVVIISQVFVLVATNAAATGVVETEEKRPGEFLYFAGAAAAANIWPNLSFIEILRSLETSVGIHSIWVLINCFWKDLTNLYILLTVYPTNIIFIHDIFRIKSIKSTGTLFNLLLQIKSRVRIIKYFISLLLLINLTYRIKLLHHSTSRCVFKRVTGTFANFRRALR